MFCRMCGAKIDEGEPNCPQCGTKIRVERRLEQLKEAEIQKPNVMTSKTIAAEKKVEQKASSFLNILDQRKQKYLERRKKFESETTEEKSDEPQIDFSMPKQETFGTEEPLPDIDISDLQEKKKSDIDLEDIDLEKLEEIAGMSSAKEVRLPKIASCNDCGSVNGTILYCPHCGKQFCSDCAPEVVPTKQYLFYTCPKCGKKVIVEKGDNWDK